MNSGKFLLAVIALLAVVFIVSSATAQTPSGKNFIKGYIFGNQVSLENTLNALEQNGFRITNNPFTNDRALKPEFRDADVGVEKEIGPNLFLRYEEKPAQLGIIFANNHVLEVTTKLSTVEKISAEIKRVKALPPLVPEPLGPPRPYIGCDTETIVGCLSGLGKMFAGHLSTEEAVEIEPLPLSRSADDGGR